MNDSNNENKKSKFIIKFVPSNDVIKKIPIIPTVKSITPYDLFIAKAVYEIFKLIVAEIYKDIFNNILMRKKINNNNNNNNVLFSSVTGKFIYNRIILSISIIGLAFISLSVEFFYEINLIILCIGLGVVALIDAGLIAWGMASRDYAANASEMEEVLDFLLKQKAKGGGPPEGYQKLFPDNVHDTAAASDRAGVLVGRP